MDLRIGVNQTPRELELELVEDTDREALVSEIESLLGKGDGVLSLTDRRGRRVLVPVPQIAWVEVGEKSSERRVGFGAS